MSPDTRISCTVPYEYNLKLEVLEEGHRADAYKVCREQIQHITLPSIVITSCILLPQMYKQLTEIPVPSSAYFANSNGIYLPRSQPIV